MGIYSSSNSIGSISYGSNNIIEVYNGSKLVWGKYSNISQFIYRNLDSNGKLTLPTGSVPSATSIKSLKAYGLSYAFTNSSVTGTPNFSGLKTIGSANCLAEAFSHTNITSISFPNLTAVTGNNALNHLCYYCSKLSSVNFSKLTTITGSNAFRSAFGYSSIPSITFTKLSTFGANDVFSMTFSGCSSLTNLSFPALKTTSFSSYTGVFKNIFNYQSVCTVHFPSNLSSTVSGLTGYPLFGGKSGNITLKFDLTATS